MNKYKGKHPDNRGETGRSAYGAFLDSGGFRFPFWIFILVFILPLEESAALVGLLRRVLPKHGDGRATGSRTSGRSWSRRSVTAVRNSLTKRTQTRETRREARSPQSTNRSRFKTRGAAGRGRATAGVRSRRSTRLPKLCRETSRSQRCREAACQIER